MKKKNKKINILKVTGAITILLAIYIIHTSGNVRINMLCIFSIFINYLYIATPITRKVKKGGKKYVK